MKVLSTSCPMCGGRYDGVLSAGILTCEYCGSRFMLEPEVLEALGATVEDEPEEEEYEEPEPMFDFVQNACQEFLKKVDRDHFQTSRKIVKGLEIADGIEVYLIHDDTLFKSGKNGFAITDAGLYCREMGDGSAHYLSWGDLAEASKPEIDDSYIRVDNVSIAYFTDGEDEMDELLSLFKKLRKHAKRFDWSHEDE